MFDPYAVPLNALVSLDGFGDLSLKDAELKLARRDLRLERLPNNRARVVAKAPVK